MLRVPTAAGSLVTRSLLVKRHASREPSEQDDAGRTLFVTHLDNFLTEAQLMRSFGAAFGPVDRVVLKTVEKKAPKAEQRADNVRFHVNFACVIFKETVSLEKAMETANGRITGSAVLPLPGGALKEEVKAGKTLYREASELRQEIDEWMAGYDARQEEQKRLAREAAVVDDDGFQKVVSGITRTADGVAIRSAKRPSLKTGAFSEPINNFQDLAVTKTDRRTRKKREQERPDFYKFQQREKRREDIIDHRKRVAQDEEKVVHMRKAKRFKVARAA